MTTEHERRMIESEVDELNIDGMLLTDVHTVLKRLRVLYGDTARISERKREYSDNTYFAVVVDKPESDEQFNYRVAMFEKAMRCREDYERKEFERLSAKFKGI